MIGPWAFDTVGALMLAVIALHVFLGKVFDGAVWLYYNLYDIDESADRDRKRPGDAGNAKP
jgi:hypothetical protein